MFTLLQIATALLVAIAMALALAHALELPGKMRLNQATYYATQAIYYPGFTMGGISEPVSIILTAILLWLTPAGSAEFWLTLLALIGLIGMQAVYWLFTHPVNQFWVEGESLDRFSSGFFTFGTGSSRETDTPDWTELRDRWEYSHVARAVLGLLSLIALLTTLA